MGTVSMPPFTDNTNTGNYLLRDVSAKEGIQTPEQRQEALKGQEKQGAPLRLDATANVGDRSTNDAWAAMRGTPVQPDVAKPQTAQNETDFYGKPGQGLGYSDLPDIYGSKGNAGMNSYGPKELLALNDQQINATTDRRAEEPQPEAEYKRGDSLYASPWRPTQFAHPNDFNPLVRDSMSKYTNELLKANGIPTDGPHANAFRHGYMSAYEAYKYGSRTAKALGEGYETTANAIATVQGKYTDAAKADHLVDEHNNQWGRKLGKAAREQQKPWSEVEKQLLKGISHLNPDGCLPEK